MPLQSLLCPCSGRGWQLWIKKLLIREALLPWSRMEAAFPPTLVSLDHLTSTTRHAILFSPRFTDMLPPQLALPSAHARKQSTPNLTTHNATAIQSYPKHPPSAPSATQPTNQSSTPQITAVSKNSASPTLALRLQISPTMLQGGIRLPCGTHLAIKIPMLWGCFIRGRWRDAISYDYTASEGWKLEKKST